MHHKARSHNQGSMGNWVPKSKEASLINEMNNSNKYSRKRVTALLRKDTCSFLPAKYVIVYPLINSSHCFTLSTII
jgi:hypothetical protein